MQLCLAQRMCKGAPIKYTLCTQLSGFTFVMKLMLFQVDTTDNALKVYSRRFKKSQLVCDKTGVTI